MLPVQEGNEPNKLHLGHERSRFQIGIDQLRLRRMVAFANAL